MGRIVGNILALLLCVVTFTAFAELELRITDIEGHQIKQAAVGVPFVVEVLIAGAGRTMQQPVIKGVESFGPPNATNLSVVTINGKTTVKHSYEYQTDKPGIYSIGPAEIEGKGTALSSNIVTVLVGENQLNSFENQQKAEKKVAFAQLLTSASHLVVGQAALYTLRVFYRDDIILKNIGEPHLEYLQLDQPAGPFTGKQTVDGVEYKTREWRFTFCPRTPGEILIPAYAVDFEEPSAAGNMFGGFGAFFNIGGHVKRSYSNSLKLVVDPLPEPAQEIDGVGIFTDFTAKLEPAAAKEGEGMVLSVVLTGQGAQNVKNFSLQLPEQFKWYDSKNTVTYSQSGLPTRTFEFIVQGLKAGNWEIAAQRFSYYDLETKSYKALQSTPFTVSIVPGNYQPVTAELVQEAREAVGESSDKHDDEVRTLASSCSHNSLLGALPWSIFFLLTLLPLVPIVFRKMRLLVQWYALRKMPVLTKKNAGKRARALITDAAKNNDTAQLYGIMRVFLSDRLGVPASHLSSAFIDREFSGRHMEAGVMAEWHLFFDHIAENFYYPEQARFLVSSSDLFKQAHSWIDRLEKLIK
jgi:hypothetical protein